MPTVLPSDGAGRRAPEKGERKLTGFHVLLMLIAFFGIVGGVDGFMIVRALGTFRGEVAPKPYEQGLKFNKTIQESREQDARGWKVDGRVRRDATGKAQIEVDARDAGGAPVTGLQVEAILAAPADKTRDHAVKLEHFGGGVYRGATDAQQGAWDLELTASRDGRKQFQSRNRITIQ
jgi:nitrogen fixation protein FixH